MKLLWLYLRWLALPLLLFGLAILWPSQGMRERMFPQLSVRDRKIRRTVKLAEAADVGEEGPLYAVNRPGIRVDLAIDPDVYMLILNKKNRRAYKQRVTNVTVRFGDRAARPATLTVRGAGTLEADLPSFKVKLFRREQATREVSLKRFYLMSLSEDAHQIETAFGYRVLTDLGLFLCHYQYVTLSVNGAPHGVYLLLEPPRNAIRRARPKTVAIHRRQKRNLYKTYWAGSVPDAFAQLSDLRSLCYQDRVADPLRSFGRVLDLQEYFRWTAVNSVIFNRDTLDELFLYEQRPDPRRTAPLRVMAWDYDDILVDVPKKRSVASPLMFSCLDQLDAHISGHPELYAAYRARLRALLASRLTVPYLQGAIRAVVALRNRIDDGRPAGVQRAERAARTHALRGIEQRLKARHAALLRLLDG